MTANQITDEQRQRLIHAAVRHGLIYGVVESAGPQGARLFVMWTESGPMDAGVQEMGSWINVTLQLSGYLGMTGVNVQDVLSGQHDAPDGSHDADALEDILHLGIRAYRKQTRTDGGPGGMGDPSRHVRSGGDGSSTTGAATAQEVQHPPEPPTPTDGPNPADIPDEITDERPADAYTSPKKYSWSRLEPGHYRLRGTQWFIYRNPERTWEPWKTYYAGNAARLRLPDADTYEDAKSQLIEALEADRKKSDADAAGSGSSPNPDDVDSDPAGPEAGDHVHSSTQDAPRLNVVGSVDINASDIDRVRERSDQIEDETDAEPDPDVDPKSTPQSAIEIQRAHIDRRVWCRQNPARAALWVALACYGQHDRIILTPLLHRLNRFEDLDWTAKNLIKRIENEDMGRVEKAYDLSEHEHGLSVLCVNEEHPDVAHAREILGQRTPTEYHVQRNTWSRQ